MKKTTRILAVLMTVCLLFGVVCAFASSAKVASAKKESDLFVKADGTSTGTMPTPVNRYYAAFDNGVLQANPTLIVVTKDGTGSHEYIDSMAHGGNSSQKFQINAGMALKAYPAGLNHVQLDGGEGYIAMRKVPGSFRITDESGELSTTGLTHTSTKSFSVSAPEWYFGLTYALRGKAYADTPTEAQHLNLVDFAVVDFDYGTDRWAYKVDGVWQTGETVPTNADPESVKPGFACGVMDLCYNTLNGSAANSTVTEKNSGKIRVAVCQDAKTGVYFLSNTDTYKNDTEYNEGTDMLLSSQPGVLNHFTYVFDVTTNAAAITGVDVHIYVNGEYFCTKTLTVSGYNNMVLHSVYVYPQELGAPAADMADGSLVKENDCYSLSIDNIVTNYYKKYVDASSTGYQYYETANGSYGLDDFFASESVYKSVNLANCPDTLYGIYETRDDAIAVINGTKYKVVGDVVDLGDMISNNSVVSLPVGKKFTATPKADAEAFSVTLGEGAKIELINASYKFSELDADTNTYTATKIDTKASLTLLLKMNFNFYVPADTPFVDFFGLDVTGPVDATVGGVDYKQFTWTPEIDSFETNTVTLYYDADKTLACTTVLDVLKYASDVADEYVCGSAESTLVYETMKYKIGIASYTDDDFNPLSLPALNSFFTKYANHQSGCTCKDTCKDGIPSDSVSKGTLEGLRVSYMLDISEAGLIIDGTSATDALTLSYNKGTETVTLTVGNGIRRAVSGNSVFYVVDGISIENISSILTVTNGTQSGTYSLYAHIQALTAAEKTDAASVASSLYAYSVAAKAYVNSLAAN